MLTSWVKSAPKKHFVDATPLYQLCFFFFLNHDNKQQTALFKDICHKGHHKANTNNRCVTGSKFVLRQCFEKDQFFTFSDTQKRSTISTRCTSVPTYLLIYYSSFVCIASIILGIIMQHINNHMRPYLMLHSSFWRGDITNCRVIYQLLIVAHLLLHMWSIHSLVSSHSCRTVFNYKHHRAILPSDSHTHMHTNLCRFLPQNVNTESHNLMYIFWISVH